MKRQTDRLDWLKPAEEAIEKRRKSVLQRYEKRSSIASTVALLLIISALVTVFCLFFGLRIISGNGMYPALCDGDLVLTYFKPKYVKNETVFYNADGKEYFGRIVAKEGDRIDFSSDGKFFVNDSPQTTNVVFPTYPPEGWSGSVTVPEGTVFILGDYRTQTEDSRKFGFIPVEDVTAKVIAVLRHKKI